MGWKEEEVLCRLKLDSRAAGSSWIPELARAGSGAGPAGAPERARTAAAPGGGALQAPDWFHWLGRPAGPPDHANHRRRDWGRDGGRGPWGALGVPGAGKSPPHSAGRPLDIAYKPEDAEATRSSRLRDPARGLRHTLILPQPPRLSPPPPPAAGFHRGPSYNNQLMGVGVGMCTAHARNPAQEGGGIAFLPLGRGAEWQQSSPAPSGSKLRNVEVSANCKGRTLGGLGSRWQTP